MKARFRVEFRVPNPPADRTVMTAELDTLTENLIELGAIDPFVSADMAAGAVETDFTVEAPDERAAFEEAFRLLRGAIVGGDLYPASLVREEQLVGA